MGKAVACLHSCQESYNWPFYKQVMGALYGPTSKWTVPGEETTVYPDQEGAGHETTAGYDADAYVLPANQEEYYLYDENPRGMPGITVMYSVIDDNLGGASMGGDHPVIWIREDGIGRSYFNALNHASLFMNEDRQEFYVNNLVKSMYWIAGYDTAITTGCTDSNYAEYDPEEIHGDPAKCLTLDIEGSRQQIPVRITASSIEINESGPHLVVLRDVSGKAVMKERSLSSGKYSLNSLKPGFYTVRVTTTNGNINSKVLVF
jgi:hypothetical protein